MSSNRTCYLLGRTIIDNDSHERVTIVILTHANQREMTLRCLRHIFAMRGQAFDVVLWDNGSVDDTVEAVHREYPSVFVHHCPRNLGVASGRNAGAELAVERFNPTYFLFLDNDIEVEPGFLTALMRAMKEETRVGQVQAKLRCIDRRDLINDGGGCQIKFWRGITKPVGFEEIDKGQYDTRRECICGGGAMLARADLFRELEGFDPIFDPVGPEDLDYCLRLQRAGYRSLFVPEAVGYHHDSHSFDDGTYSEEYAKHKAHHWFHFLNRHAPIHQKVGFYCISGPLLMTRLIVRECRSGNFGAIRGTLVGLRNLIRTRSRTSGEGIARRAD